MRQATRQLRFLGRENLLYNQLLVVVANLMILL